MRESLEVTTGQEAMDRLRNYLDEAGFLVHKGFIGKARTKEPMYLFAQRRD